MTDGTDLGAVIERFLADAAGGRARDNAGQRYDRASLHELRAALAHVDSELGDTDVHDLSSAHVARLLGNLADTGLSSERIDSIIIALHRLHAYAAQEGLTDAGNPLPDPAAPDSAFLWSPAPRAAPVAEPVPESAPPSRPRTPTLEMLGAARSVATWTVRAVVFTFALLLLLLILEL